MISGSFSVWDDNTNTYDDNTYFTDESEEMTDDDKERVETLLKTIVPKINVPLTNVSVDFTYCEDDDGSWSMSLCHCDGDWTDEVWGIKTEVTGSYNTLERHSNMLDTIFS